MAATASLLRRNILTLGIELTEWCLPLGSRAVATDRSGLQVGLDGVFVYY